MARCAHERRRAFGPLQPLKVLDSHLLRSKLLGAAAQLRYLPRAMRIVRVSAGHWTAAWLGLLGLQGLIPVVIVQLSRPLVDHLSSAVGRPGDPEAIARAAALAAAVGVALIAGEVVRSLADGLRSVQARRVDNPPTRLLHHRTAAVAPRFSKTPPVHPHPHPPPGHD